MDWVEGDPLGIWLDKNFDNPKSLEMARIEFCSIAEFLAREGIAHGDIQNGNVMLSNSGPKLIDYDGMFVSGLAVGNGSETGHKHFQHPDRRASDFGPKMDRFSFIALELSLEAVIENKSIYKKFREGGETIIFKANDFVDPRNSEIFGFLFNQPKLRERARNFAAICDGDIGSVPTLAEFLAGKNIPAGKAPSIKSKSPPRVLGYIGAFPVIDGLDYEAAARHVGDRVELVGRIVEVKPGVGRRGRGKDRPYVFINFGPWKGNIVKISIWSEGLDKLREKPSNTWVGRWVSVTGLLDPPYTSRRFGYTHLSLTVQEDGQIHQLDEAQARFRLASIGKSRFQRNRDILEPIIGGAKKPIAPQKPLAPPAQTNLTSGPSAPVSRNREIVDRHKRSTSGAVPIGTAAPSSTPQAGSGLIARVPVWLWIVAAIALLLLFTRH
jgi:hypothetical protein